VEFHWGERQEIVMRFRNRAFIGSRYASLTLSRDVVSAAPVKDEIVRPFAMHAAHVLEDRSTITRIMLAFPIFGEFIALSLAHGPTSATAHEHLSGCVLVYTNDADVPISILLCGLAPDISMVMDEIPVWRKCTEPPAPFDENALKEISDRFGRQQRFEY